MLTLSGLKKFYFLPNFIICAVKAPKVAECAISNCVAEQAIRPQTMQRKNPLFYCIAKGTVNSAIYNTFIETCKQASPLGSISDGSYWN